jgi:hypothetical protein
MLKKVALSSKLKTLLLIILLLGISLLPRLWKLSHCPPTVVDEPAYLRDINKIIHTGFLPANPQWDGSQATLAYSTTIPLILIGVSGVTALRTTSVIFSLLACVSLFFILKKYFSNFLIPFCVTLIFSSSYFFLQFSRTGWGVILPVAVGLFSFLLAQVSFEKKSLFILLLSSFFTGIISYLYRGGEIFIGAIFLFVLIRILKEKYLFTKKLLFILSFLFVFLLTSLPWFYYISRNWEKFNLRGNVVSVVSTERPYPGFNSNQQIFSYQIVTTFKSWILMLPIQGNAGHVENSRYLPLSYPPISPILIPLYLAGLLISIKNWKKTYFFLFIFLVGLIFSQILTVYPPNGARALIFLPSIYFFIAQATNKLYLKLNKFPFAKAFFVFFFFIVAISDVIFYFNWMTWIKV